MNLLLQDVRLSLPAFRLEVNTTLQGRVAVLFGPSGAGKTSLLDLIAGLRRPESGRIQLAERVLTDTASGCLLPPRGRAIGYVPQDLALFPHCSVRQNVLYGHRTGTPSRLTLEHVAEVLEIGRLLARTVHELSGGEQQRVALARALLAAPQLLLLDEPLASLDPKLKSRILPYFARIRDEFKVPIVLVTHDRLETLTLGDTMLVIVDGRIAQQGSVHDVFSRPANVAVAGLLAVETVQPGHVTGMRQELATVSVGQASLLALPEGLPAGCAEVFVCIRAEDVIVSRAADTPSSARNHLAGTVCAVHVEGPLVRLELDCGFPLMALLTRQACAELQLSPGVPILALIKAPHVHLIPRSSRRP